LKVSGSPVHDLGVGECLLGLAYDGGMTRIAAHSLSLNMGLDPEPSLAIAVLSIAMEVEMKALVGCAAFALIIAVSPANAKGCLKGAVIGGTAGHVAGHHGILGAAAGCIVGRHEANKRARTQPETDGRGRDLRDTRNRI
jgi:hypothetical protein